MKTRSIQVPDNMFGEYLEKMANTFIAKNNDYAGGDQEKDPLRNFKEAEKLGVPAYLGILVRMTDKWMRIQNIVGKRSERMVMNESVADTILDLANYSIICLMAMHEGSEDDVNRKAKDALSELKKIDTSKLARGGYIGLSRTDSSVIGSKPVLTVQDYSKSLTEEILGQSEEKTMSGYLIGEGTGELNVGIKMEDVLIVGENGPEIVSFGMLESATSDSKFVEELNKRGVTVKTFDPSGYKELIDRVGSMTLMEYQELADSTAIYPGRLGLIHDPCKRTTPEGLYYVSLGLAGEAGEFAEKVKKLIRDHWGTDSAYEITEQYRELLLKELGDILWYVAAAARELYSHIGIVGRMNIDKLEDRRNRMKLQGTGDTR